MDNETRLRLSDLNLAESYRQAVRWSNGTILEEGGVLFTAGPDPHPMMNVAMRTDPDLEASEFMARTSEFYGERGHAHLAVVSHHGDPDLIELLTGPKVRAAGEPPAMFVDHALPRIESATGVTLRVIEDASGVEDFRNVARQAWTTYQLDPKVTGRLFEQPDRFLGPHQVSVVAYLNGEPAACALVILSHGIAGVYWVSSLESARRKGLGEAVTRAVTNAAFERGACFVTLQASAMGETIYRRMGYYELSSYRLFACL